jgi:hypothetical protein
LQPGLFILYFVPQPAFMKIISSLAWLKQPPAPGHNLAFPFALILIAVLSCNGCSKSKPPTTQAPVQQPVTDTNQTSAAVAPQASAAMTPAPEDAPSPTVIAASPSGGADLRELNHAYIGWVIQNGRHPKSFDEFVATSGMSVPPPPTGKKYIIDKNGFINLANN